MICEPHVRCRNYVAMPGDVHVSSLYIKLAPHRNQTFRTPICITASDVKQPSVIAF
jgi:hypothetical protein